MNKFFLLAFLLSCTTSILFAQSNHEFKTVKDVEATVIKSQDNTGTCWSFATTSMVESELMRLGKGNIDLSEMFVVRQIYIEKALNYIRRQGKAQFGQGSLSHDLMTVIKKYGMVPESAFPGKKDLNGKYNHSELESVLKGMLDALVKKKGTLSEDWLSAYEAILDVYLGKVPSFFEHEGKTYTPSTFADEVMGINPKDYVEVTSYSHHPFYEPFVLEIPDNFSNGIYHNVTINELEKIVNNSIDKGYSVGWDCDVSEKTFSSKHGVAIIPMHAPENDERLELMLKNPTKEAQVDQEMRQSTFDDQSTTDDHLMHITGIAKDKNGDKYYIVKNSWGERGPFKGYLYASRSYFRLKTVAIMVHKDAIPTEIAQKMGL